MPNISTSPRRSRSDCRVLLLGFERELSACRIAEVFRPVGQNEPARAVHLARARVKEEATGFVAGSLAPRAGLEPTTERLAAHQPGLKCESHFSGSNRKSYKPGRLHIWDQV